jgi:hypothetical protein
MTLRQRQPRKKDARHLDFIRSLPCCVCGGIDTEAAHLRVGSIEHGKRNTGMAEKPNDAWCLPLCNRHHREQHAAGNELKFWDKYSIDPFLLAIMLNAHS